MPSVIEMHDVSKVYPGSRTAALDHVTVAVEGGAITAIMGPSGGGKSTLLNLAAAMDRPTRGKVTVAGTAVERLNEAAAARFRRTNVGLVFQFFNLLDDLSVRDNVALPARLAGVAAADARRRADGLLERLGLGAEGRSFS